METIAPIEPLGAISPLTEEREVAAAALAASQTGTASAKDAVAQLEQQLTAERNACAELVQKFDLAAVREQHETARELQSAIAGSDIRRRGLEIRLESARQELKECQQTEARLGEDLGRLLTEEAIEAEAGEVEQMIAAAQDAYDQTDRAAQKFEAALIALKTKAWRDDRHRHQASDAVFSLTSRCKGFRY
jgi:hypothetical protein